MSVKQNARVYYEMYGGIPPEATSQYVHVADLLLDIGGWAAADRGEDFQLSVYGRAKLGGANLVTLLQRKVSRPAGNAKWKRVHVVKRNSDSRIQCVVARLELIADSFTAPDSTGLTFHYDDQYDTADAPPWGVRIKRANLYCTSLHGDVRPHRILWHILDGGGFEYDGPTASWEPDQMAFVDLPKDRWEALDEINGMLGWNYHCWDGQTVTFSLPKSGTVHQVDARDPRSTWNVTESLDETYNAVRVLYQNAKGKPREVVIYGDTSAIGIVRADTLQAPDSIKSLKAATRFGNRYLRAHEKRQVSGTLSLVGYDPDNPVEPDPLLIKPGDVIEMTGPASFLSGEHEVTRVTLRPLEHAADVEFGTNSKRFDTWLARLAVGAKSIKRR